jgi:hypothetical protein
MLQERNKRRSLILRYRNAGKNDLVPGDKVNFEAYPGKIVKSRAALVKITKLGEDNPLWGMCVPRAAIAGTIEQ